MVTIGVLGAYGRVGLQVLKFLYDKNKYVLYGAGRRPDNIKPEIKKSLKNVNWFRIDVNKTEELETFVKGKDVIVNCTGPSAVYSRSIAKVCQKYVCKYVDTGHRKPLKDCELKPDHLYIYAAGACPGLSAFLCRYMAGRFQTVDHLVHMTVMDGDFTKSAAWDYIDGITGEHKIPPDVTLVKKENTELPFVDQTVELSPYWDEEAQSVAQMCQPAPVSFYAGFPNPHFRKNVEQASILFSQNAERAAEELAQKSRISCSGGDGLLMFLTEISGISIEGKEKTETLAVRTKNPSDLTGETAAVITEMIAGENCGFGLYPLCRFQNYKDVMNQVQEMKSIEQFQIFESDIRSLNVMDEGEI